MTFTPWQRLIAEKYGGGDYQHVADLDECRDVGDSLFTFLMVELDPKEDCSDWVEALRRIETARLEIEAMYDLVMLHAPYCTERGKAEHEAAQ